MTRARRTGGAVILTSLTLLSPACVQRSPRPAPSGSQGRALLVVRSDRGPAVREDDARYLGYSVYARDGRLVLRSSGFSTDEDRRELAPGTYRVVSAPAGLLLDDPPEVEVVLAPGASARLDLRRR